MPAQTEQLFLALLRSELAGVPLSVEEQSLLTEEALNPLYTLAKRHDLAHLVTGALEKAQRLGEDAVSQKFKKARYAAVYRYEQIRYELDALCRELGGAGIAYLPLKGAVLREWYPEPWMRTSCDIDVLVKREDLDRAAQVLTERLGYQQQLEGTHDVGFFAPGGLHVELHYDTVEEHRAALANTVLNTVWDTASTEDGTGYRMSAAMFYFYHIAHMAKHIEVGGCGVRTFMDLWILNHRVNSDADADERRRLLSAGGLARFADAATQLSEHWFSGGEADALCLLLEEFILYGGVYGNIDTLTAVQQNRKGGRFIYLFGLIFPRYRHLKYQYPVLKRQPWLYPFCLLHRLGRKTFGRDRRQAAKKFARVNAVDASQRDAAAVLLNGLGLAGNENDRIKECTR